MKSINVKRFLLAQAIVCVVMLTLGIFAGWALNNSFNSPREKTEKQLADTQLVLADSLEKLSIARSDRDFYKKQVDDGTIPSRLVKVIYEGNLKETPNNAPESGWKQFELARDYPDKDGVIHISSLGEIAAYAAHDKKVQEATLAQVVEQFGSTEQSGPGR